MKKLLKIKIINRSYGKASEQPLYITQELKTRLEGEKWRDGGTAYTALLARGFRGGKHLLEIVGEKFKGKRKVILSHDVSSISPSAVTIDFEKSTDRSSRRGDDQFERDHVVDAGTA